MTDVAGHLVPVKGEVAVFRGGLYQARAAAGLWPCVDLLPEPGRAAPADLAPREAADGSVGYPVPPERLEAWYSVRWTFRWRNEPFDYIAAAPPTLTGDYLGSDEHFAKAHLRRRGIRYRGTFPRDEVTELEEHREDLLQPLHALMRRLPEVDYYRPGTYAVYRGHTYPAAAEADVSGLVALTTGNDRPEGLVADPRNPGAGHFLATPAQLDAWYRTHWTFRSNGGPFDAVGTVDGRIKGIYTGGSWGFVNYMPLTEERGPDGVSRFTVMVDLDGATDLEQQRTDLSADHA
ncbi:hypothetical protein EDD96_6718 [Streptomyces sp. Ag109_G2-6]|uniref:hypothetical protein n=1 Tax=Streptomyces TaxID=1883 RepID=UPI0009A4CA8E|nr:MULTISPECIES: hypothetical protein [Streptomyces]RPF30143.1 hypothetical protein EDD96_6718 [Streptomyces sp. Ag109_G2-6]